MLNRAKKQSITSEIEIFGKADESYGDWDEDFYYGRVEHFVSLLPKDRKLKGLDIGCGNGIYTCHFAKFDSIEIVGMDLSEHMLEIAREKHPQIRFDQGNAQELKYEDAAFDFCTSFNVVHHFPDKYELFKNISRVLKPGGLFYCEEPNGLHVVPFIVWSSKGIRRLALTKNEFPINPYKVAKAASKAGLKWVDSFPIHPHWNEPMNFVEKISLVTRKILDKASLMMPYRFENSYDIGLLFEKS